MIFDLETVVLFRKVETEQLDLGSIGFCISKSVTTTMGNRQISNDLKRAAVRLYIQDILPLDRILDAVGFSECTFYRSLKNWRETGDVVNPRKTRLGRRHILIREDIDYLLELIRDNPDYFLDELLHLLKTNRFISVHYTTIHRELERCGVSYKKLKRVAAERNEDYRADFIARMAQYTPDQLGFLDETSKDERTLSRHYGRGRRGKRSQTKQVFVRGRRVSAEALLSLDGIVAGTVVEGSMTKEMFLEYLELNVVRFFALFRTLLMLISLYLLNHI